MKLIRAILNKIKDILSKNKFYRELKLYKQVIIKKGALVSLSSILEGKNRFETNCKVISCKIGFGTYLGPNCDFEYTKIGKYCSIAQNVKVIAGNHPTHKFVSTHPSFFSTKNQQLFNYVEEQLFEEYTFVDKQSKWFVEIGNDVWIGSNVSILSGVKIGDGSIIGACALVTKDVEPYGIYCGIPAKKIRNRFKNEDIMYLMRLKWWDKSEQWIKNNAKLFSDIESLKKTVGDDKNVK